MWTTKAASAIFGLALLAAAVGHAEEGDPFRSWRVSGYLHALALHRNHGMPLPGRLDSDSHEATGLARDGVFLRKLEFKLSGPLATPAWSATLGVQTDLSGAGLADAYLQWEASGKAWSVKAGQVRLPFGSEAQTSGSKIWGIQRSLAHGLGNYGHIDAWGLAPLAERGWGLRLDAERDLLPWMSGRLESAALQAKGNSFNSAPAALGRVALKLGQGAWGLELGASGHASRANLGVTSAEYAPLGAEALPPAAWTRGAGTGGRATILTWGQELRLDLGLLHGHTEWVLQRLGELTRSGARLGLKLEIPWPSERRPYAYALADQASSGFADGVHRPDALYRAETFGISLPLPWQSSLRLESLCFSGDDFPGGFQADRVYQGQWQLEF